MAHFLAAKNNYLSKDREKKSVKDKLQFKITIVNFFTIFFVSNRKYKFFKILQNAFDDTKFYVRIFFMIRGYFWVKIFPAKKLYPAE